MGGFPTKPGLRVLNVSLRARSTKWRRRRRSRARCWPTGRARARTCSQPTKSPRRWWRTAQPASSIAAALLSYYTIAQVDGLLAGKLGVTEAASALQIAVRFPDDGGADEAVAAIGEQILGPTDVSLSNWTVRRSAPAAAAAWSWPRTPRE